MAPYVYIYSYMQTYMYKYKHAYMDAVILNITELCLNSLNTSRATLILLQLKDKKTS